MEILFQDDYLVAVNKPAGMLVHRTKIDRNESVFAMQLIRNQLGQHVYPVHRLDKPTSGVLLFALNSDMARSMTELFTNGAVYKHYMAVVRGYADSFNEIDYPLKEQLDKMTDASMSLDKPAQKAITRYKCLNTIELPYPVGRYESCRYSLLELIPKTGRKHQIRRHMKHIFHPIIGDTTHGDSRHNTFFREHMDCHRLLLAATHLSFTHPQSGHDIQISAPLENNFQRILNKLDWSFPTGKKEESEMNT